MQHVKTLIRESNGPVLKAHVYSEGNGTFVIKRSVNDEQLAWILTLENTTESKAIERATQLLDEVQNLNG